MCLLQSPGYPKRDKRDLFLILGGCAGLSESLLVTRVVVRWLINNHMNAHLFKLFAIFSHTGPSDACLRYVLAFSCLNVYTFRYLSGTDILYWKATLLSMICLPSDKGAFLKGMNFFLLERFPFRTRRLRKESK